MRRLYKQIPAYGRQRWFPFDDHYYTKRHISRNPGFITEREREREKAERS